MASVFNKHFSNIGHKLSKVFGHVKKVVLPQPCTDTRFELKPIPVDFVYDQLRGLKANKAIGLDKISARLLKDASEVISPVLTNFINLSIEQSYFPNNWKSAIINCNNYRPISILPTVSKIIERSVHFPF